MNNKELNKIEEFHKKHANTCCTTNVACGNIVGHFFPKLIQAIRDRDKLLAALENCYLCPESGKYLSQFQGHRSPAYDD